MMMILIIDYIIRSIDELNKSGIQRNFEQRKCALRTKKRINPKNFNIVDLVFRLMTFDHIPVLDPRKKKNKNNIPYMKLPFP